MEDPIQELAPRISDCLKVIYAMQERGQKVSTSAVSECLGDSDATVTMLFKDFANAGWVEHAPYHGVTLTPLGERKAMEVIRHHRLLVSALDVRNVCLAHNHREAIHGAWETYLEANTWPNKSL